MKALYMNAMWFMEGLNFIGEFRVFQNLGNKVYGGGFSWVV